MSDRELRDYERALLRENRDPRAVAAGLLGVSPDRYLLLVRPHQAPQRMSQSPQTEATEFLDGVAVQAALDAQRPTEPEPRWRRVTGVRVLDPTTGVEQWIAFWALPVTALEEVFRVADLLDARHDAHALWDVVEGRMARPFGSPVIHWAPSRIEDGWRTPRDGPAIRRSTDGLVTTTRVVDAERGIFDVRMASDEPPIMVERREWREGDVVRTVEETYRRVAPAVPAGGLVVMRPSGMVMLRGNNVARISPAPTAGLRVPSPCPICERQLCDHTPAERGQTLAQVMGDEPAPRPVCRCPLSMVCTCDHCASCTAVLLPSEAVGDRSTWRCPSCRAEERNVYVDRLGNVLPLGDAPTCRDCQTSLANGATSPGGRCPPCASIASGHGL
jgi:hypothetical protein